MEELLDVYAAAVGSKYEQAARASVVAYVRELEFLLSDAATGGQIQEAHVLELEADRDKLLGAAKDLVIALTNMGGNPSERMSIAPAVRKLREAIGGR